MTEEAAEALRVYRRQVGAFHTPLGCDDEIRSRSFACNVDYIYEFDLRKSDDVVTLVAYRHPDPPEDWRAWAADRPQPRLGRYVGRLYRGPVERAPLPGPDPNEA